MKILALDPAGNFFEGKGTTGYAMYYNENLTSVGQIVATEFENRFKYWQAHIELINALTPDIVVIENYVLYPNTKEAQIGSEFETPQLIGILKYYLDSNDIEWFLQKASIKPRYKNEILLRKGIITQRQNSTRYYAVGMPLSGHILDAIRHGEYFIQFNLPKVKEKRNGTSS